MNDKSKVEAKKIELMTLTLGFCSTYLDDEYKVVIEQLINKMARKRTVPFLSGRIEIWAAAIIHAIGTINFLFDSKTKPYVSVGDIINYYYTSQSTVSQKSRMIQDMFKMSYFDSEFSTSSNAERNPFNDMIVLNGLMVPKGMFEN